MASPTLENLDDEYSFLRPYLEEEEKKKNKTEELSEEYSFLAPYMEKPKAVEPTVPEEEITGEYEFLRPYLEQPAPAGPPSLIRAEAPTLESLGITLPQPLPPKDGILRQAADLPIQFAIGVNNSVKALTDLFGADNEISQNLNQNVDWYRSLLSASSKQDEEEIGRILQDAENKGMLGQLAAGLEAFTVAPADFVASGLGSLATFAATGLAGRAAAAARIAQTGVTGAKAAATAEGIVRGAQVATGMGMGAGIVKGQIYESVKEEMLAQGKTEEQARQVALEAQSYDGKNLPSILLGAGLGALDAFTGAEKVIGKILTKGGIAPNASRIGNIIQNGLTEGAPEFLQAAQEKLASNIALRNEGVEIGLTDGVFAQGALEGLVGVGMGLDAGAIEPRTQPATKEEVVAAASETQSAARQSLDVAPATASLVEGQAEKVIQERVGETMTIPATVTPRREGETDAEWRARTERERAETPDERVARLQREAQEAAGIELEEEGAGLPPVSELPPVKEGFVRLYHGGASATAGEFTPSLQQALGFAQQSKGSIFYVDVPQDSEFLRRSEYDEQGNISDRGILVSRQILPDDVASSAQRVASGFEAQPVTPTPEAPAEAAAAPVEPVVPAAGVTEPAVTEVAPETVSAPVVVRRGEAGVDTNLTAEDKAYRGMTEEEFNNTVLGAGGVESRGDFRFGEEGTNFAEKFEDAESYINFGRDDPRKTGKPTYIVEVDKQPLQRNRRGDYEAFAPVAPTKVWKITAQEGELVATEMQLPAAPEAAPAAVEPTPVTPPVTPEQKVVAETVSPAAVLPEQEPADIPDTRGQNRQFHGAREPIPQLTEGYYNAANIYGGESTFYTTDAVDIAAGYQRRKPNSVVYEVTEKAPVNFFNMEERRPVEDWIRVFNPKTEGVPTIEFFDFAAEIAAEKANGTPNLREVMDEMRAEAANEGYSRDTVQEFFAMITENLEKQGYGGMTHIGGLRTNRPQHNVKIYFKPAEQLNLQPVDVRGNLVTPEGIAPAAEVTPAIPQLEPLRRVARAEQTEEDVAGLVDSGFVEVYNGQPVITQAGIDAMPEAERPRLTPEARKIQIDTRTSEAAAEAISKNLRIGVDQVPVDVRMPAGWTLEGDIYVPPTVEAAPEVAAPEAIAPEKQVVPQEQEQVAQVVRVDQEQVNQGKPDVAKIINQFTVLERAAVAGKLLEEGYIDGKTADRFVKEATNERTGGFSMAQIGDAQASADEKFNQQIAAARTSQPVAGEVSPEAVDLEAEQSKRSQSRERVSPAVALKPKSILGKTAREALAYLSSLNLSESKDWDAEIRAPKWTKDPNYPKPFYAQIQDAAAILSKLPLKILDADKIVSNAERGFKGGAKRFGDGDIGIPLTETARVQTASGSWVRRSVEKPLNVATLVHEVGHTLTADAVNRYITSKNPKGSEYLKVLDGALKVKSTPQPIKDLIVLYKTTISQLGIEKEYFGKKGLAGGRAKDSQLKAYNKKIVNNLTGNPFTWSQYYGLANIDEFVAQAWSSQSFQDLLKQIKAPDQQSLWTKFTRIIRDLFGFPSDSMASAVIDVSMQIAELETPIGARKGVAFSGVQVEDRIAVRGEEPAPPVINIWQAPEQEITSQETSINERKIPAVFNQVKEWKEGTVNADIGGGRFDNVTNWLRDRGVENLIIDWFNRDRAFNEANINRVRGGRADTATISNVLNVIQEPDARELVIRQAADALKEDGTAYFYIYEGNGSGQGRATTKGWQENRKAASYMDEISQHFENVERRNQMIVATGPIKEIGFAEAEPEMPSEAIPTFTEGTPEAATLKAMEASMAKVDAASEAKGGKPETQKISDIAVNWMDQGGDERALQDAIVENTNLTPANAARVAKAIARQYDIQQSIATAFLETQTGLSVEALPEGVALPKEVDPDRPKPVMQRLFEVFMGVRVPPTKITVNEKTALKQQIRLKAAANRAAKAAQKETSDQVIEVIKAMDLRGGVRPKQVQALAKRAAKVIWTNEKSLETFADYAAKVVENANYDADLREAKAAQARAKQLSKQKKIAMGPQREMLDNISKIAVNRLDDPRMYADVVNYYLRGFKAVLSPDYVVVPDSEMTSYLSQMQGEATRNQRDLDRAVNERLAEKYGVDIDDLNSVLEAADIISQLEANENREAMDNLLTEKAIETRDGLKAYDQTPLRADQRKLVDAIMKVDPKALDAEERQRFIRITNNIIYNNQTNGAEYFASVAKGQQSARAAAQDSDMIAKNKAWINLLPRLVSERMQRGWALELQSVADTFRNAFGKGAMAKVYKAMGMLDLNMGFTKANNTIDEIQEKIAEFHTKLEKKYKAAARNQDGLLAEGVAGFLIQKVPNKGETESIAQRRDLIRQDIANRRRSGEVDRIAMADRIETILNQIDGEGVQAVLNNLKQTYPANHESLVWYKDTLLPQYKEFLKNFDENFNDQANNYDNPDYLPIAFSKASPSLAITKEEESVFFDQVSLRPKQSAYTIKRLDYAELPRDRTTGTPKEIEFNLRRNAFDSLSDQINKAYTSGAWQQVASFMKTPEATAVFGGQANKDFFVERLNRLRLSRMRRGAMSRGNIERAVDSLSVISRKLGTGIALGGVYQWIKQPPDQLVTALGSGGRYDLMAQNIMPKNQKAARELLRKFSIGRRGDASSGYKYINQMEGHQNRLERYFSESKWDQVKEEGSKVADVWMAALKQSDFWAASTAWMTYYEGELNKRDIKIEDWAKEAELVDTDPARQEAAAFAEQMTDIYQGSSDPTQMATFAQSGKSGWENLMKAIFVPFNSFAIQQRMRLYSDARDVLNGEKSGVGGLTGTIGGLLLFHATKRLALPVISGSIAGVLYALLGVDMEEPDEEKQKEEANKRWRQMQGEMLGNLLVGGTPQIVEAKFIDAMNYASYLISLQLESESVLNDEGEVMSFDQYAKERSPFWRYRSFDNAMSLGMLDIGLGQAEQAILQTKMVATPEEMEMYTPEEQRLLYFSALSEWLYLMRLNDADFARIVSKARRDMMTAAKDREKELKRIREGR